MSTPQIPQLLKIKRRKQLALERTRLQLEQHALNLSAKKNSVTENRQQLRAEWIADNQQMQLLTQKEVLIQKEKLNQYYRQDLTFQDQLQTLQQDLQKTRDEQDKLKSALLKNLCSQEKFTHLLEEILNS